MKNYYEILAYADREDLLVEKTNTDTYIGFKDGEESKTLFRLSDGRDPLKDFLEELQNTKYKESNLYKIVAKTLIKDLIEDDLESDPESTVAIIEEFKTITGYEYDQEDFDNLEKHNIVRHWNGYLCNKSFFEKDSLIDYMLRSGIIYVSERNSKNMAFVLPDFSYIVGEIDYDVIEDTFYSEHHYYASNKIENADYYEDLVPKIEKLLSMIKNNEVKVEYETEKLKDNFIMEVFWTLSNASNLLSNNNYDSEFTKEHLNYYDIFYNGKVVGEKPFTA